MLGFDEYDEEYCNSFIRAIDKALDIIHGANTMRYEDLKVGQQVKYRSTEEDCYCIHGETGTIAKILPVTYKYPVEVNFPAYGILPCKPYELEKL